MSKNFKRFVANIDLYLLLLPTLVIFFVFKYMPMYGVIIAFKDFTPSLGIWGSPWVGFDNFKRFFMSYQFSQTLINTLTISVMSLILSFPAPIVLAIMLNQTEAAWFKKVVQTVTYIPHFISTVVLVGLLFVFLSPLSGPVNMLFKLFGMDTVNFMGEPEMFSWIYVISGIWQSTGYNAIIFIAALAGINPEYYEAAMVDGATKFKRIIYIDLPALLPTITIMFILNSGRIMSIGFEKAFLMQTPLNTSKAEILATYVYKVGMIQADNSFSTAVNLFNTLVNLFLIFLVNGITRKLDSENSLW